MKIAITGHRPNKLGNDYAMTSELVLSIKKTLQGIIDQHRHEITHLISGMALGIDTLWAELAIENNIPLIAAIPCTGHHSKWKQESKDRYQKILSHPNTDTVYVSTQPYTPYCMQVRNQWMVDACDILIAVWDGSHGGTANCIAYAMSEGMGDDGNILRIFPAQPTKYQLMKTM